MRSGARRYAAGPAICVPNRLVQATNRRHIPDISMGWSVVGLVVVLLGCSGIYAWWKRAPQAPVAVAVAQRHDTSGDGELDPCRSISRKRRMRCNHSSCQRAKRAAWS